MRFLHTITSIVENTPGRILVQSENPARQKPLENGGNTPFLWRRALGYTGRENGFC
jgi:hypothetical protein